MSGERVIRGWFTAAAGHVESVMNGMESMAGAANGRSEVISSTLT